MRMCEHCHRPIYAVWMFSTLRWWAHSAPTTPDSRVCREGEADMATPGA